MQDRISQDRRKPLATHGRTIHWGHNPNASRMLACQLLPAADKPPYGLYSAMCHISDIFSMARNLIGQCCDRYDFYDEVGMRERSNPDQL
jgi:hypothetical protein